MQHRPARPLRALLGAMALSLAALQGARAERVSVAVASNFSAPMQKIAAAFEAQTGHGADLSFGATGKLYAQISNGAPFELLLAADAATPARLEREGRALAGTRFTYALGTLVLWSAQPGLVDAQGAVLKTGAFKHLALANPRLAPYGAAAMQVLEKMGLAAALQPRLVLGENIAQTFQFVASGNAQLGFVARSQLLADGQAAGAGSAWQVPDHLYSPIRQDALLLLPAKNSAAARALLDYLKSDSAHAIIAAYGYGQPR